MKPYYYPPLGIPWRKWKRFFERVDSALLTSMIWIFAASVVVVGVRIIKILVG